MFFINLVGRNILIASTAIRELTVEAIPYKDYEYGLSLYTIGKTHGYQIHITKTRAEADKAYKKFIRALNYYAKREIGFVHHDASLVMSVESKNEELIIYDDYLEKIKEGEIFTNAKELLKSVEGKGLVDIEEGFSFVNWLKGVIKIWK